MHDLVIRAARAVVDGEVRPIEVGVTGGTIAELGSGLEGPAFDLTDDEVLIPGLVDTHVHVNEPGRTEWEGFASATRAAAAGGVTTILDMPLNSIPSTVTAKALEVKRAATGGQIAVDVGFWGGAVPQNLGSLRELHESGVFGFKAFLSPSGVAEFDHLEGDQLDLALAEVAELGALLILHAEEPSVLDAHPHEGGPSFAAFAESRPPEAELAAIRRVIDGVRRTGARAHIEHLASGAALPLLRAARAEGLPITVETCPHYLALTADLIPDGATQYKCCPPIRDSANRDALWRGLLDGDIDLAVSDHSPATADLKFSGGDFGAAWGGIAGLQLGLPVVWTEAARRGVPLERVVSWMSSAPAGLVGLSAKGGIRVGGDADLAVFAPDETFVVHASELEHRNPVTPYDGMELRGVVRRTWVRGAAPGAGRLLAR